MGELIVLQDACTIQLTRGRNALVDSADFLEMSSRRWQLKKSARGFVYATRTETVLERGQGIRPLRTIRMHRILCSVGAALMTDHINGDTLDNRRSNLRPCTRSQNKMNAHKASGISRYKGVVLDRKTKRWRARYRLDGRRVHIGFFATEAEAARAYDAKARESYGEFALTNAELYGVVE